MKPLIIKNLDGAKTGGHGGAIRWALKKPIPIRVRQMRVPFVVETLEGTMTGDSGDWLMEGVRGELYPCSNEIFNATYEFTDAAK